MVIGLILIFALVVLSAWNAFTNYQLLKLGRQSQAELSDSKYYELKYKMQFLVAMFAVFATLASLYGYNTLEDAKEKIARELNDQLNSLRLNLGNITRTIAEKDSLVRNINNTISKISDNVPQLSTNLRGLERKIQVMNEKNILKQNYYIVSPISYLPKDKPQTIFLNDLKTNLGDKLPVFKKPPLIILIAQGEYVIQITNVTTESFEIAYPPYLSIEISGNKYPTKLSVLIFEI